MFCAIQDLLGGGGQARFWGLRGRVVGLELLQDIHHLGNTQMQKHKANYLSTNHVYASIMGSPPADVLTLKNENQTC